MPQIPFCDSLVHGHSAAQRTGAGVGDSHEVEYGLYLAVLPVGAVQSQEHHVCRFADVKYAGTEEFFPAFTVSSSSLLFSCM